MFIFVFQLPNMKYIHYTLLIFFTSLVSCTSEDDLQIQKNNFSKVTGIYHTSIGSIESSGLIVDINKLDNDGYRNELIDTIVNLGTSKFITKYLINYNSDGFVSSYKKGHFPEVTIERDVNGRVLSTQKSTINRPVEYDGSTIILSRKNNYSTISSKMSSRKLDMSKGRLLKLYETDHNNRIDAEISYDFSYNGFNLTSKISPIVFWYEFNEYSSDKMDVPWAIFDDKIEYEITFGFRSMVNVPKRFWLRERKNSKTITHVYRDSKGRITLIVTNPEYITDFIDFVVYTYLD